MKGNHFYKRLGKSVLRARTRRKYSQEVLGHLCCLDRTYIARIEGGHANPTIMSLYRIAKSMKMRVADLLRDL